MPAPGHLPKVGGVKKMDKMTAETEPVSKWTIIPVPNQYDPSTM